MVYLTPRHGRSRQTIADTATNEAWFGRAYSLTSSISSCGEEQDGGRVTRLR